MPERVDWLFASRREFVQGVSSTAGLGMFGIGTGTASPGQKKTPVPYEQSGTQGDSLESDVYLRHISELGPTKQQIAAYEQSGDFNRLLTFDLHRELLDTSGGTIDVTVSTCGARSVVKTSG